MNKTVVVKAYFITYEIEEPKIYDDSVGDKIKNFFLKAAVNRQINSGVKSNKEPQKHISDKTIDIVRLNEDINREIIELNNSGYEVVSITPITSGEYKYDYEAPMINARDRPSYGWGYGFSYTCGVIIMAKKLINGK